MLSVTFSIRVCNTPPQSNFDLISCRRNTAFATIGCLTNLRYLSLSVSENVTDAGLKQLALINNLECLYLHNALRLTDGGLIALSSLKKLRDIGIWDSKITSTGTSEPREISNVSVRCN